MSGFVLSEQTKRLTLGQPFVLESGQVIPEVEVAYRTWGTLTAEGDNAVVVCHALTGSADADEWWAPLFGSGRILDPAQHFILCSNVLGGCYGTTGPTSIAPDGRPWGARFPRLTIRDQVRLQIALANQLGIRRIRFVIGGSMGGLHALEWGLLDPQRVTVVISIAASGQHSPWCIVWSEAQRKVLTADPKFRNGLYPPDDPPTSGLAAARAVAMITYRSPQSLEQRFGRYSGEEVFGSRAAMPDSFAVRGWLHHHGQALVKRFDANSYIALLNAMDTHDLGRGRGGLEAAFAQFKPLLLVGSVSSDALYIPSEQQKLAAGVSNVRLVSIESDHGHDGFLIDAEKFEPLIRKHLDSMTQANAACGMYGYVNSETRARAVERQLKFAS